MKSVCVWMLCLSSFFILAKSLSVALPNQPTDSTEGAIQFTHSWMASFESPEHGQKTGLNTE